MVGVCVYAGFKAGVFTSSILPYHKGAAPPHQSEASYRWRALLLLYFTVQAHSRLTHHFKHLQQIMVTATCCQHANRVMDRDSSSSSSSSPNGSSKSHQQQLSASESGILSRYSCPPGCVSATPKVLALTLACPLVLLSTHVLACPLNLRVVVRGDFF